MFDQYPGSIINLGRWEPPFTHPDFVRPSSVSNFEAFGYTAESDTIAWDWMNVVGSRLNQKLHPSHEFTVRPPSMHRKYMQQLQTVQRWHRDNAGVSQWMIVWASEHPTEIEVALYERDIFQAEPFDVVAIRNDLHRHRTPLINLADCNRWFARGYAYL